MTPAVREDVIELLDMKGCKVVCVSPDRPNIYYKVRACTEIENDLQPLVDSLQAKYNKADCAIVYCRSRNTVAALYAHFLFTLGDD